MYVRRQAADKHLVLKTAVAAILAVIAASILGCNATKPDLRALYLAHPDCDQVGSMDATAQPPSLAGFRHPETAAALATVSISRHPQR